MDAAAVSWNFPIGGAGSGNMEIGIGGGFSIFIDWEPISGGSIGFGGGQVGNQGGGLVHIKLPVEW